MQLVQQLISSHKIVGIQETHAKSKLEAENFFFQHVEALKFYDPTYHLVILVDRAWADANAPEHVSIVPGAIHGIRWTSPAGPCLFLNFYLNSSSDHNIKITQLRTARAWAETHVSEETVVFASGDRNHIRDTSERIHTEAAAETGLPNVAVIGAWDDFCAALNHSAIVPLQSGDFTFMRRNGTDVVCSVLDVFTTNVDTTWEPLYVPVTERIPTSGRESMDHSPIGLTWALARGAQRRSFRAPQPLSESTKSAPFSAACCGRF